MQATRITNIHQPPRSASDTAAHYGYVAFKDIELNGSTGKEYFVQPDISPYYNRLPCREMIPFTNITIAPIDDAVAGTTAYNPQVLPVRREQKTARVCAEEMEGAYQAWNFKVLRDLTGFTETDAFHIFQTIQPFVYLLKDIEDELEFQAVERIAQNAPYNVTYGDLTVELQPLPEEFKAVAERVRQRMAESARKAVELGEETKFNTTQSMTQFFSSGTGKRRADPLDQYVFKQFDEDVPKLLNREDKPSIVTTTESVEMIALKERELALRERELAIKEEELALMRDSALSRSLTQAKAATNSQPDSFGTFDIGQSITVADGQQGTIISKPFGKLKIQFADGTQRTVKKSEIR